MKITEKQVNLENLDSVLERSRLEFLASQDEYPEFRNRFSIGLLDPLTEIKYFEICESGEVRASFQLVYRQLKLSQTTVRACFLTQVIVTNRFRGQGLMGKIVEYADRQATADGAGVTFVVARRAARDLYAKFGFVGFSHFSKISLRETPESSSAMAREITTPKDTDLQNILSMYENSYSSLNFFFIRSVESFNGFLRRPKFNIGISLDKSFYFISSSSEVFEIGLNGKATNEEVIATLTIGGFDCLKLNRNHKIAQYAISRGMQFSERFELREGHLFRVHGINLNVSQRKELEGFIQFPGNQIAEILEIDQW